MGCFIEPFTSRDLPVLRNGWKVSQRVVESSGLSFWGQLALAVGFGATTSFIVIRRGNDWTQRAKQITLSLGLVILEEVLSYNIRWGKRVETRTFDVWNQVATRPEGPHWNLKQEQGPQKVDWAMRLDVVLRNRYDVWDREPSKVFDSAVWSDRQKDDVEKLYQGLYSGIVAARGALQNLEGTSVRKADYEKFLKNTLIKLMLIEDALRSPDASLTLQKIIDEQVTAHSGKVTTGPESWNAGNWSELRQHFGFSPL